MNQRNEFKGTKRVCFAFSLAMVTGWGATSYDSSENPATLLQATLKIVNPTFCKQAFKQWTEITDEQICAGVENWDKDSCQGDSGKNFHF